MQKIKTSLFIVPVLLFTLAVTGFAMDTDLYVLSGVDVPPNVLILLDNSASMERGEPQDKSTINPLTTAHMPRQQSTPGIRSITGPRGQDGPYGRKITEQFHA